jgi:hypothetical protein
MGYARTYAVPCVFWAKEAILRVVEIDPRFSTGEAEIEKSIAPPTHRRILLIV